MTGNTKPSIYELLREGNWGPWNLMLWLDDVLIIIFAYSCIVGIIISMYVLQARVVHKLRLHYTTLTIAMKVTVNGTRWK